MNLLIRWVWLLEKLNHRKIECVDILKKGVKKIHFNNRKLDIWSRGEITDYLKVLLKKDQIKDCQHLKIDQEFPPIMYILIHQQEVHQVVIFGQNVLKIAHII